MAIKYRRVGKKVRGDLDQLQFMPKIVVDGQNVAFQHGSEMAKQLKQKKFFSYEALFIVAEKIFRCGFSPKIVLPAKHILYDNQIKDQIKRNTVKKREKFGNPYSTIEQAIESAQNSVMDELKHFRKYNVFVPVNGDWEKQSKKDDVYALYYAFQTKCKIISNDKYRRELEAFSESEPGIWNSWLEKNRLGFNFENDQFIIDDLDENYKMPSSYEELKQQSGLLKYWEETEISMANSGDSFGWSDLY